MYTLTPNYNKGYMGWGDEGGVARRWGWGRKEMYMYIILKLNFKEWDFPGDAVVETLSSQCRGPGFDPWSGN